MSRHYLNTNSGFYFCVIIKPMNRNRYAIPKVEISESQSEIDVESKTNPMNAPTPIQQAITINMWDG